MLKEFLSLVVGFIFIANSYTQSLQNQVIAGAGGSFVSINTLDYTLGETMIDLYKQTSALHQGFHQVIVTKLTTSVDNTKEAMDVNIYPNPSSQWLNVTSSVDLTGAKININDINGQIIYMTKINSSSHIIDLQNIPTGIYGIQIVKNQDLFTYKFIKTDN